MTCEIISTGGKPGNAVLLNGNYLFDCGVPFRKIRPYLKQIKMVFLTHVHADHFNIQTLNRLHQARPTVRFVCARNLLTDLVVRAHIPLDCITLICPEHSPKLIPGAFAGEWIEVNTFPLIHDVENVGYVVKITGSDGDGTAMYATDTHHIPVYAPDLDLYMIEANYTEADMERREKARAAAGKFGYESRVRQTHMSLETAVEWLRDNADHERSRIVFLHGHTETEREDGDGDGTVGTGIRQSSDTPKNLPAAGQAGIQEQL